MAEVKENGTEHRLIIDPVGFISEIMNNIGDQRDIIRELLSNAASKEVRASKIDVRIYESDRGLAFTVTDDGQGMNYTKDSDHPGRLDRFLNAAQGKQAGFESDEFGAKGLGTKLLYNSDRVEVETWDGGDTYYRVIIDEPRRNILEKKILTKPVVHATQADTYPLKKRGTTIRVMGWGGVPTVPKDFKPDRMERYLTYYTVAGYTKTRETPLPEIILHAQGQQKSIKTGFPYLSEDNVEDLKTVTFGPIRIEKKTHTQKPVHITLKGGVTTDTGKFQLTEETGGVWLSVNGIPYFKLTTNKYSRRLNFTDDFTRFVVECEDVGLNMSRSDFTYDESYEVFEDALREAFGQIKEDSKFERFYQYQKRSQRIRMQTAMNTKKEEFSSEDKRYVWYDGKMVLAEPESEYDTAALLWILEGRNALPFHKFQTLQYPGYREGIDLLVNYQERADTEEHLCAYAELERLFSSFIRHRHDVGQMTLAFCWKLDKGKIPLGTIKETSKPYKHTYSIGDTTIPVFEINAFPGLFVGTKKDAKENPQELRNHDSA